MVAAAAGVSQSTVSLVLNNYVGVAMDTRLAVIDAARKLGYPLIPQNNRRLIGVIIGRSIAFCPSYHIMCLEGLKKAFSARGYMMELVCYENIALLNERSICGGIVISGIPKISESWGTRFTLPLVRISTQGNHADNIFTVYNDVEYNLGLALDHLRKYGHRRIGLMLGHSRAHEECLLEKYGPVFLQYQRNYGIGEPEKLLSYDDETPVGNRLEQLLARRITGLIVVPGDTAQEVVAALHRLNLKIPDDLSVVSREYSWVSQYQNPPMTTVMPDYEEIGHQALYLLDRLIEHDLAVEDVAVKGGLIKRDSVGCV